MSPQNLLRQGADPDAAGGRLPQVNGAIPHGERHGLIVFALADTGAGAGMQRKAGEKFQKFWVLLVNAQNFDGLACGNIRKWNRAMLAPKLGEAASQRHTVGTKSVGAESR